MVGTIILITLLTLIVLLGGAVYLVASLHGTLVGLRKEMDKLKQVNANLNTNSIMWQWKYKTLHDTVATLVEKEEES